MYAATSGKSRGRGRSNSNAALALLPVSAALLSSGPEGQVSATSSMQQQQSSQLQSAHRGDSPRAASGLRGLSTQILLHSSAQGNQILDSMSSQALGLVGPNFAVHPSAMPQELLQSQPGVASRSQRVLVAAQLLGLPVSLLSRLAPGQPQDQSPFWRRWGIWLIGVLITTIAPRLLFQLLRLLAERLVSASVGTFWKVSTAATDEATDMSIRFVHFLEDTLGICLVEPEVTPTSVHAVGTAVQQAAATAAAQTVATTFAKQAAEGHLDPELVAKSVSQAVRAAVEASQTTAPHHSAPELGDWRLPGWVIFVAGVVINGFQHRVSLMSGDHRRPPRHPPFRGWLISVWHFLCKGDADFGVALQGCNSGPGHAPCPNSIHAKQSLDDRCSSCVTFLRVPMRSHQVKTKS